MTGDNEDIAKISKRIKQGDVEAFESLFTSHFKLVYQYVHKISKDHGLSLDTAQETFISLWTHKEKIDNDRSIIGLLYKTAHNRYVDQCRKDQRQQILKQEFYIEKMSELIDEDRSKKNKKIKLLRKEIALLPPKCREIFELAKLDGLKYKEIAAKLKVSVKTVENQMGIALTKLREALKEARDMG